MKIRTVLFFLVVIYFLSFTISSVTADTSTSIKRDLFAYLIDDCIRKCQAKIKLSESRSKNLRINAALSELKAQYFYENKYRLIEQILAADLPLKKYKVHHFINAAFFSYYESKSSLQDDILEVRLAR